MLSRDLRTQDHLCIHLSWFEHLGQITLACYAGTYLPLHVSFYQDTLHRVMHVEACKLILLISPFVLGLDKISTLYHYC